MPGLAYLALVGVCLVLFLLIRFVISRDMRRSPD